MIYVYKITLLKLMFSWYYFSYGSNISTMRTYRAVWSRRFILKRRLRDGTLRQYGLLYNAYVTFVIFWFLWYSVIMVSAAAVIFKPLSIELLCSNSYEFLKKLLKS